MYAIRSYYAVESLLDNKAENTFYDVYCLTPCEQIEFTEKTDKLRQRYNNFSINFIYMNEHFENVDFGDAKISPVLYYRLKISDLLDDYDKAIYFDVDVIINRITSYNVCYTKLLRIQN